MQIVKYLLLVTVSAAVHSVNAQDSSKVFVTTGAGIIKSPGALSHVLHPSIAFNSGLELVNKKGWFAQGTVDFNSLKYNQRIKEDGSPYLFKNTSSSLIMLAINGGKNFYWNERKWFASLYTGAGYLNIGEPRLLQDNETTIRQEVSRKGSVFGKAGTRIAYKTKLKLLQTIYFDGSYWRSPLTVQGSKLSGVSLFLGLRMTMK
ncbi:hypothetical protein [Terrimonas pollutisoli]|uniref:hypothetical protein n=1 Tax=Terrimonas pollutisoli TaxID=3034147 RepID=UPI0023EBE17F|nr:hypothetical protein [Terrimonas sp. H1YJ31]